MSAMAELSSTSAIRHLYDALREQQLPSQDIVLILAVLLYLRWADFQEAELEAIAAFDDTDYEPVLPASLHWRTWHQLRPDDLFHILTERLPVALRQLSNSRHNPLATHLHRIAGPMERLSGIPSQSLFVLVQWLAEQPFETPNDRRQLLTIFDEFLYAKTYRLSGEFMTPPAIARLIVELAAPAPGEKVYDPCFGSAGLLTAASEYVLHTKEKSCARYGMPCLDISGIELNESAYIIGLTRLALAGIDSPQLELGNSLERTPPDNPQQNGFDLVIANPPFGMRNSQNGLDHFPVRTNDASGLFIQHALAHLRPNGRAVIIVPQGLLFRGGPDLQLRQLLLEQHTVEAVISLPHGVFLPNAGIKASILVLRRNGPTKSVRMLDAEPFFEKGSRNKPSELPQSGIEELVQQLRGSKPGKHCWDVDIETLAEVDWDLTSRRRDQSGLMGILDSLRSEIEIVSLKQCCTIASGRAFSHDQLLNAPPFHAKLPKQEMLFSEEEKIRQLSIFDVPVIPYVRIKDIQRGQASSGSSWVTPSVTDTLDAKWKLKAGDILLSKSGTIGKVGVVRNGAVGAIAASGLFVLRPDQDRIDPHFLVAYLVSSECRVWLNDNSSGGNIQHLSVKNLEKLLIPLPPFQIQKRVATEHREHGVDALTFLAQLLTKGEQDPIADWIDKVATDFPTDVDAVDDPLNFDSLDRLATSVREIRNRVAHGGYGESILEPWLLSFSKAVSGLHGVRTIPQGPSLLNILQESLQALKGTVPLIKGYLPNEAKARNLNNLVLTLVDRACTALLSNVTVTISADAAKLSDGEMVEISLVLHNQGPLPLRNLKISTSPDWGQGKCAYFAEGAKIIVYLVGIFPKKIAALTLSVNWSANTLDGQQVQNKREITFDTFKLGSKGVGKQIDLGKSPYFVSQPVGPDRDDVFFGREDQLEQIRRQVSSGNVILLEGNRRSGKSSILKHLEGSNAIPHWFGIYCSFQGAEGSERAAGMPTVEVWREMARSLAEGMLSLGEETPLPGGKSLPTGDDLGIGLACRKGISTDAPWIDFREYLKVVIKILTKKEMGLLLMLDEFDKLQEGIDNKVTSPQLPENIRYLIQNMPNFSAILTGSRRMKRLREEYWSALYGLGHRVDVSALPEEAARRLVTKPVEGRLIYSQEAINLVIYLTSRQPFLIQCLCNRIFEMAVYLKSRTVTLDMVNQAGDALVDDNEHLSCLWDYAKTNRRRFMLALFHRETSGPDLLRLGVIQEYMFKHGIGVSEEALIVDLEFLQNLELIELIGEVNGGYYKLAIPLMGMWIEKQQDFAAVISKARSETEDQHE